MSYCNASRQIIMEKIGFLLKSESVFIITKTSNLEWRVRRASAAVQNTGDAREPQQQAAVMGTHPGKINLISCGPIAHVLDIKLIRPDTILDLSQNAEKV